MERSLVKEATQKLVRLLVDKRYSLIYDLDKGKRLTEDEIITAIADYKGELTYPPEKAFDDLYLYAEEDNEVRVEFDLWYDNQKSDLTLSFIASVNEGELFFSLQDIHVL